MNRLWAPWRKAYIRPKVKEKGCLFCRLIRQNKDDKNFIFKRSKHAFAMLNLYPYNNGHAMIVPFRHVDCLSKLRDEEKLDLLNLYDKTIAALEKAMRPEGFNTGINMGRAAGAGVPGHVHFHIVPRWAGDSNFMPVIGATKVISESLESAFCHLKKAFQSPRKRS